ncbi:MAG: sensor histidine kinase, partial [Acidobacteriaceae bacterium]|nr:sensor histidine kinase [Acidobacteriaceae bacterium]
RDYLLDQDPAQASHYIQELNKIHKSTEDEFRELDASGQADEQKSAIRKLRREFEAYWDPAEIALDWTPAEKRAQRAKVLHERVRRREEVFALAAQVEQLTTANFLRERQRIMVTDQEFQASLGWTTALAFVLGLTIAGVTFLRLARLERQSAQAESELRRLSGQLRTAQEQERRSLSRELHDQVGQMLTGLRMELASLNRPPSPDPEALTSRIEIAKGTVEQTLRVVRNIAMLLRPSMLDDLGLAPALNWLAREMSRSSGIEVSAHVDPALDSLPDSHRTCLFRVVQEALTNAIRHSGCSRVDLTLECDDAWVTATISDNGRGFEESSGKQRGLGLVGMDERARELGGSVRIDSPPGRGTRVEVKLPRPAQLQVLHDQNSDSGRSRDRSDRIKAAI